jgi:CTP:molybdopterin cytidylyltransferase MocA
VQQLQANGLARVVALLHPTATLVQTPQLFALHGDPDATPLHSLQRALAVADGPVLVLPIDCRAPSRATTTCLLAAAAAEPVPAAVRPIVATAEGNRGGHPLWLSAATCAAIRTLDATEQRLDTYLRALGPAYAGVVVRDPSVLDNFNRDGVSR